MKKISLFLLICIALGSSAFTLCGKKPREEQKRKRCLAFLRSKNNAKKSNDNKKDNNDVDTIPSTVPDSLSDLGFGDDF